MPPANSARRSRSRRWIFGVATAALVLLTAELLARVAILVVGNFGWQEIQDRMARAAIGSEEYGEVLNPYLGISYDPLSNPGFKMGDRLIPVNRLGFTGETDPVQRRAPDRFIVGIVGGSFAWALGHETTDTLRRALSADPRLADREIVIVDLAIAGFKEPQQVMAFNYVLALGGEFDVLVNLDGFNEVALGWENYRGKVACVYPKGWAFRVHDLPDTRLLAESFRIFQLRARRQKLARDVKSSWFRDLALRQVWWRVQDIQCAHELERIGVQIAQHRDQEGGNFTIHGPVDPVTSDADVFLHCARIWQRCSRQLHDVAGGQGTLYLHFLQPNQYLPDSKPLTNWEQRNAFAIGSNYQEAVEQGYPLLQQFGRELQRDGIRFHDLTSIFRDHPEGLYVDWCCHLNREGYDIVTRQIAREILAAWIPPTTTASPATPSAGDASPGSALSAP